MTDSAPAVLLDRATIDQHVRRLADEIVKDHPDGVLLVGILKGALIFLSDLARAIQGVPVEVDFMSISRFAPDSGRVRILHDVEADLTGRDVVIVEDIVDTGLTLAYLIAQLSERAPRSLRVCALLDRPVRRIVPQVVDYCGYELRDEYVLGYGLHIRDLYRNVPYIAAVDRDVLVGQPDIYVHSMYRGGNGHELPVVG